MSKPLGWLMLALMPIAALVALYLVAFLVSVLSFLPQSATIVSNVRTISPLANFLLPGINPYLPLSVWLAIVVAVFIHEASHGIVARNVGMKVKAAGGRPPGLPSHRGVRGGGRQGTAQALQEQGLPAGSSRPARG